MGFRSFIKKVGKGLKKVAVPLAAVAAPFIPGIGGAIAGGISKIGGMLGMGSSAQNPPSTMGPNDGPQPDQVQVSGQREPFDWGGLLKTAIPAVAGWYGQQQTNSAQAAQAQKQMDFQADQTGTSYQRAVADMKAAGLNPMLAYSQGGAASGGGAQATLGNEVGAGMASAVQVAMTRAQLNQLQAQTDLTLNQSDKTVQDTKLSEMDTVLRATQDKHENARVNHTQELAREVALRNYVNTATQRAQIELASSSADLRRSEAEREGYLAKHSKYSLSEASAYSKFWDTEYGRSYPYLEKTGQVANSAFSAIGKLIKPDINIYRGK